MGLSSFRVSVHAFTSIDDVYRSASFSSSSSPLHIYSLLPGFPEASRHVVSQRLPTWNCTQLDSYCNWFPYPYPIQQQTCHNPTIREFTSLTGFLQSLWTNNRAEVGVAGFPRLVAYSYSLNHLLLLYARPYSVECFTHVCYDILLLPLRCTVVVYARCEI